MIYTDGVHVVADSLEELHAWAKRVGIGRHRFHGMRRRHPHYDVTPKMVNNMLTREALACGRQELLERSKAMLRSR